MYDEYVVDARRNLQGFRLVKERSQNTLNDPFLFSYRSFVADIANMLTIKKNRTLTGYTSDPHIGAVGTPIMFQYVGLGYVEPNVFYTIPIVHTLLHGICKDVCSILFGSRESGNLNKNYTGEYRA